MIIYDFLKVGLPIIVGTLAAALIIFIIVLILKRNRKSSSQKEEDEFNLLVNSLGGRNNILSITNSRSRINLKLKNPSLIDRDSLRKCGVTSIVNMSEKISLVFSNDASKTAQKIENLL